MSSHRGEIARELASIEATLGAMGTPGNDLADPHNAAPMLNALQLVVKQLFWLIREHLTADDEKGGTAG